VARESEEVQEDPVGGPNFRHPCLMVSGETMMPRFARSSSTSRKLKENLWYSQTLWLMTSRGNR